MSKSPPPVEPQAGTPASGSVTDTDATLPPEIRSPETQYLTGIKLVLMTASLTTIAFIMMLNASIVATAIPSITSDFHSITDIGWYGAAYLVSNCALQPLTGKIYTLYSSKYTFLSFLGIFELGSLISGVARSSDMLIIGRAVTGIGGSGLINGALTIMGASCAKEKRPVLMGFVYGVGTVGQVIGPLIGGAVTQHLSWRWCFYLNLPAGASVALLFLSISIPDSPKSPPASWREVPQKLDLVGFVIFAPAIIMILLGLQWGGSKFPWNSATVIGLIVGGVALLIVFGFWEHHRGETAMIPLALLKLRVVHSACITGMLQMGGFSAVAFYLPTWFQLVKEFTPTLSGVNILPIVGSQILASITSGILVSKIGYYTPFALLGNAFTTIGSGLTTTFTPSTRAATWIGYLIITGAGRGMAMQQPITAVQATTPPASLPIVSSLVPFCQYFGTALFVSLGTTVFTNRLVPALQLYAPGVDAEVVISAGATGIKHLVPSDQLQGVLLAANKALTETFYLAVGAAAVSFISSWGLGWKSVKKEKQKLDVESGPEKVTDVEIQKGHEVEPVVESSKA